jgi:predicted nucleic acid-binding protein
MVKLLESKANFKILKQLQEKVFYNERNNSELQQIVNRNNESLKENRNSSQKSKNKIIVRAQYNALWEVILKIKIK